MEILNMAPRAHKNRWPKPVLMHSWLLFISYMSLTLNGVMFWWSSNFCMLENDSCGLFLPLKKQRGIMCKYW